MFILRERKTEVRSNNLTMPSWSWANLNEHILEGLSLNLDARFRGSRVEMITAKCKQSEWKIAPGAWCYGLWFSSLIGCDPLPHSRSSVSRDQKLVCYWLQGLQWSSELSYWLYPTTYLYQTQSPGHFSSPATRSRDSRSPGWSLPDKKRKGSITA